MGRLVHSLICVQTLFSVLSAIERSTLTSIPQFDTATENVTVVAGKTAKLRCEVWFRGTNKVAWVSPKNTVLTQLDERIIDDMRISVERQFTKEWNLYIREVTYEDRGAYTCTINTQPMQKKTVYLCVEVPPSINEHWSSRDLVVREGDTVELMCNASGVPTPTVSWFKYTDFYDTGEVTGEKEAIVDPGEILVIHNVSRYCDGTFECVAHNNVGEDVSRKIKVEVVFPPEVSLRVKRMGQFLGKETILECIISASPMTRSLWKRNDRELDNISGKFRTEGYSDGPHKVTLNLHIINIQPSDYGIYSCYAWNRFGEDSDDMILYEYQKPPVSTKPAPVITTARGVYRPIKTKPSLKNQKHSIRTRPGLRRYNSRSGGSILQIPSSCLIVKLAISIIIVTAYL